MTTDPEAKRQADELTDAIDDIIYDHTDGGGSGVAAAEIVRQLPQLLHQAGWEPPEKTERIHRRLHQWIAFTATVPDHHRNQDTWNSHLAELTDILHDR